MKTPTRYPFTVLWFYYLCAVCAIFISLTVSQIVIQLSLSDAIIVRQNATLVHRQELRGQKILRNTFLLLVATRRPAALKELKADIPEWEQTHQMLREHVFVLLSPRERSAIEHDYQPMDTALHDLLRLEVRHYRSEREHTTALTPDIGSAFFHEIPNITALDMLFTRINSQADTSVQHVRVIEGVLYASTLLVMALELGLVVFPAHRRFRLYETANHLHQKEEQS